MTATDRLIFALSPALRLVTLAGLPGTGRLLRTLKLAFVIDPRRWPGAPEPVVRGRGHGYRVRLDLGGWPDRVVYFTGRYYERHVEKLLAATLRPGDVAFDVGANHGMVTLQAAALVGTGGRVHSVEPNPQCLARLREQMELNHLPQVTLHQAALSDTPGTLRLTVPRGVTGQGTLGEMPAARDVDAYDVVVTTGDALAGSAGGPVKLIKVDVEGFELRALRGFADTLATDRPALITEVVTGYLARAGDTSADLKAFLQGFGYVGYAADCPSRGLRHPLELRRTDPLPGRPLADGDYFWWPQDRPLPPELPAPLPPLPTTEAA